MIRNDSCLQSHIVIAFPITYGNLGSMMIDLQKSSKIYIPKRLKNSFFPPTPIKSVVFYVYSQAPTGALADK
jgi:hypothetical protein